MRPLLAVAILTQLACWSEQRFTDACVAAGHCAIDDAGTGGGGAGGGTATGGGAATGGGGAATGGGGAATGGGGAATGGGGAPTGGGAATGGGAGTGGGGPTGGGGGVTSDGGALTWGEVSGELFNVPVGLDASFELQLVPAGAEGDWVGGVLTTTGDVLCIPYAGSVVLSISPSRVVTPLDAGAGGYFEGAVLLPDGGVLGLPYSATTFLSISGQTGVGVNAGLPRAGAATTPFFEGGVITLSGKVLLAPASDVFPGVFEPGTGVLTLLDGGFPDISAASDPRYGGAVLLADGESAILVPRAAQKMMQVSPGGAGLVGPNDLQGHAGGVLLPDGRVFMVPRDTGLFAIWDGGTVSAPNPQMTRGYFSAAWSTNGYAYAMQSIPTSGVHMAIIDRSGSVTEVQLPADAGVFGESHYGLVSMADGTLVGCPFNSPDVLFVVPAERRTRTLRVMTSPWLNKW